MKKLTKIFSMALAIAMTLSVTAMAATTSTTYETTPNAYAWYNYLHREYVWNAPVYGEDGKSWADFYNINDKLGANYELDSTMNSLMSTGVTFADGHTSPYDYRKLSNYNSLYGTPLETRKYLDTRFGVAVGERFTSLLMEGFAFDKGNNAADASNYLSFITTELDNNFVYTYETYGEAVAFKYGKAACGISSGGVNNTAYSCMNAQEWLNEMATRTINPVAYQPINMVPMNGAPVANDPNKAVTTKMTMQVNGVAKTFDVMTLHNTTYFKLTDLANAMGFKYHETNPVTGGSCISNGANFTLDFASLNDKGCGDTKGATQSTILANGIEYSLCAVYSMDAHSNGDIYYRLRDIAQIMNFNIGWTAKTGTTISNKSSFNEGVSGKPGQCDSYIRDTSKWNETTHKSDE